MPYELSWEGHDGQRKMFDQTVAFPPDYMFTKGGVSDGRDYSVEWRIRGTTLGPCLPTEASPLEPLTTKV
jgi:hypothetical protein